MGKTSRRVNKGLESEDKKSMKEDLLLNIICEYRTQKALDKYLRSLTKYRDAQREAAIRLDEAIERCKDKEMQLAVDRVVSAYNGCCVEYGRGAYSQGLKDGIRLMKEINNM